MHQIDAETVAGEIDNPAAPFWRQIPKAVFQEHKHRHALNEHKGVQIVIEESVAEAQTE